MGVAILKIVGSVLMLMALVCCVAVFQAFVHIPSEYFGWGLVGRWIDPMNIHRVLLCIPSATILVIAAYAILNLLARRANHPGSRGWPDVLMRSALVLTPLGLLPVVLLYQFHIGRVTLGAAVVGLCGYLGWSVVSDPIKRGWARIWPRIGDPFGQSLWAALIALFGAVLLLTMACVRHHSMWSSLIDLGLFYELYDNPEARLLYSPTLGHTFLGEHFSPVLVVLWPLMKLFPSPVTLLVVQSVCIGAGSWLLYRLALERTRHFPLSVAIMCCYLLSPWMQQAALFDFHMDMLEPPMLFGAMLALHRKKMWLVWVCCALLWLTKEDTFLYTSVLGAYAMIFEKRWVHGSSIIAVGLLVGWVVLVYVLPELRPQNAAQHFATASSTGQYAFLARYAHLGETPREIAIGLMTRPHEALHYIVSGSRMPGLLSLIFGFGGLALGSRARIFLIVPVMEMLLSQTKEMTELMFYYGAVATMVAALPAVEGAALLAKRSREGDLGARYAFWSPARMTLALAAMLSTLLALHPSSLVSHHKDYQSFARTAHHDTVDDFIDMIEPGQSVSATGYIAVRLMQGRKVWMFPYGISQCDVILLDMQMPTWPVDYHQIQNMVRAMVGGGSFEVAHMQDGIILLKRRTPGNPASSTDHEAIKLWLDQPAFEAELCELTKFRSRVVKDPLASNGAYVSVGGDDGRGPGHVMYGPYAKFGGGRYRLVARLRWRADFVVPLVAHLPVVTMDAALEGGAVKAARTLTVGDFTGADGSFQDYAVEFEARRWDGRHEFRVYYHDLGKLDLDLVWVERLEP